MTASQRPILMVEDNDNDILLIQRAFQKLDLGCPLHVERDGETALSYLAGMGIYADREQFPLPLLILLDLKLPRKSGLEVLASIRQQPGVKRTPVVMLTSSRQAADINRAYDMGVNSYLVKPVDFDSLVELLRGLKIYWLALNETPEVK